MIAAHERRQTDFDNRMQATQVERYLLEQANAQYRALCQRAADGDMQADEMIDRACRRIVRREDALARAGHRASVAIATYRREQARTCGYCDRPHDRCTCLGWRY